jgi:uncharacterized membrane protein
LTPSAAEAPIIARLAVTGILALVLLELLWELVLAPLGGHPSWLALKAVPLAIFWPGAARGAPAPRQWLALLLPFYAAEALVRAVGEPGRHAIVAWTVCAVATFTFVALLAWSRREARSASISARDRRVAAAPRAVDARESRRESAQPRRR